MSGGTALTRAPERAWPTGRARSRRGAVVARLKAPVGESSTAAGSVRLAYEAEQAVEAQPYSDSTVPIAEFDTSGASSSSGLGVRKAVFLVNQLEGMKQACAAGDKAGAQSVLAKLVAYMQSERR